ncbi:helix-turn-helix domain-containing protein [Nocardiopsis lambiniae]|uniref:Helix-turn-helix transcriptional regulator n=1 Tax=Nocardiopsis lambiniae TaxID=3075539 RepID=A0ABU2MEB7_9ACTN|nr:helix-turn-helix transcriptional regulator [Nocardiopsis sp. DSM 44743]MDT0330880.1 helix-turn-helix transcriptional regulator [Nocardiopsis sp. DSM 44743]
MARIPPGENPAVRRFGRELARLRNLADMSQSQLARAINVSGALVGHIERAERTPTQRFAKKADEALEAGDHLVDLWKDVQQAAYPEYAGSFMQALPHALMMRDYHPMIVPGLLQSESYIRAFCRANNPMETDDYIDRVVEQRLRRQELLIESDRPVIWAIITESVLSCLAHTPGILLEQTSRLLELVGSGRVQLQVILAGVRFDEHPGMDGPFTILSLPDRQEVAYIEGAASGNLITESAEVERLALKFGSLQGVALSPGQTTEYLKNVRGEIDGQHSVAHLELQQRAGWPLRGGGGDSPNGSGSGH